MLVEYCINLAKKKATREVGCRFIVLVTKDGRRVDFYKNNGFKVVKIKLKDDTLRMMRFQLF